MRIDSKLFYYFISMVAISIFYFGIYGIYDVFESSVYNLEKYGGLFFEVGSFNTLLWIAWPIYKKWRS